MKTTSADVRITARDSLTIINSCNNRLPVVVSLPHSGTLVPDSMREKMLPNAVLPNMDWYLPELYDFLESAGFTMLVNNISRYVIDVNRSLEYTRGDSYVNHPVYLRTTQNTPIYAQAPDAREVGERIEKYYTPYHAALMRELSHKRREFRRVYLLDLHSFGLDYDADVILGNAHDSSCSRQLTAFFADEFSRRGYRVSENLPYSGGYITKHYGELEVQSLQIELWYRAYIERRAFGCEELPKINPSLFSSAQCALRDIFSQFAAWALAENKKP